MGIIVGSETRVVCDGCRAESTPSYDQRRARALAESEGFAINSYTGRTFCSSCRRGDAGGDAETTPRRFLVVIKEYESGRRDLRTAEATRDQLAHWCGGVVKTSWDQWADQAGMGEYLHTPTLVLVRIA